MRFIILNVEILYLPTVCQQGILRERVMKNVERFYLFFFMKMLFQLHFIHIE